LQTALQEARTEQEREEIQRRLKRLQEEEQQMLADVDEVRQRMDRSENQSRMAEERRQLEQTARTFSARQKATGQGSVSHALAAGTPCSTAATGTPGTNAKGKLQSNLPKIFRQMRADARELSRQQEDILKKFITGNCTQGWA
jgi:hypothetical protein